MIHALATLGRVDVLALIGSGEVIQAECEYCHHPYEIPPETLRALVDAS